MLFGYLIYRLLIDFYINFVFSFILALIEGIFQLTLDRVLPDFTKHLEVKNCQKYSASYASYKSFVIFFRNCNKLINN